MKLLSCFIYKHTGTDTKAILLGHASDLSDFSYFTRGTVAEHLQFATRTISQRTPLSTRQTVGLNDVDFLCHTYCRADSLVGITVTDKEYPKRVAYGLINQFLAEFEKHSKNAWKTESKDDTTEHKFLLDDLAKFQNPKEADKLMKIQDNLDEIKGVMHKNIEEVLKRGEKLEDLMEKAEDLSSTSVHFYKQAKKTNQCCKMY